MSDAMLIARYRVRSLDRFLDVFDAFEPTRRAHGATGRGLLRAHDEPGVVVALIRFPSRQAAETFAASAARRTALEEARVVERTDEIMDEARAFAA